MVFRALSDRLTHVEVEHRGWEHLTTQQLEAACALPGGYTGGAFNQGWPTTLHTLKEHLK